MWEIILAVVTGLILTISLLFMVFSFIRSAREGLGER